MGNNNLKTTATLEELVSTTKIFLDTSSWMSPSIETFENAVVPLLYQYHSTLVVPLCVFKEVEKKLHCGLSAAEARADTALRVMRRMADAGLIEYYGSETDGTFADVLFDSLFRRLRIKYRLALITNDYNLATSILSINDTSYCYGFPVVVQALHPVTGKLMSVEEILQKNRRPVADGAGNVKATGTATVQKNVPLNKAAFAATEKLTDIPDTPRRVSYLPRTGDTVSCGGKKLTLLDVVGTGGEGTVYRTSAAGALVKIYNEDKLTERRYAKLSRMVAVRSLDADGIAWPLALVDNAKGEFVGVLMREVKNAAPFSETLFDPNVLKEKHPEWKRQELLQIALELLDKVILLHQNNILIGDIKGDNLLLDEDGHVFVIDADSFQVAGFPCDAATEAFTPPELQNTLTNTLLRTEANENFSLAVLLFMLIALPGKHPYACVGGSNPAENIQKGEFPYALGEKSSGLAPSGDWKYCWSHLPYHLKQAFYTTFQRGEAHYAYGERLDAEAWREEIRAYLDHDLPLMILNDPMSQEIFPERLKRHKGIQYGKCRLCGKEQTLASLEKHDGCCFDCFEAQNLQQCTACGAFGIGPKMKDGLCYDCYIAKHRATCTHCGKVTTDTRLTHGLCEDCLALPHHTVRCAACPAQFEISNRDYYYRLDHGHRQQTLCPACQKLRKDAQAAYQAKHGSHRPHGDDGATAAVVKDTPNVRIQDLLNKMKKL